jgi:hypothetical protein
MYNTTELVNSCSTILIAFDGIQSKLQPEHMRLQEI